MIATVSPIRPEVAFGPEARPEALLSELMAEHGTAVLRHAQRWTGDAQRAEDVAQETWIRAWKNLDRMTQSHGSVRSWLLRVTHNVAVDQHRARSARPLEVVIDESFDPPAPVAVSDENVLQDMTLRQILAAVPEPVREVMVEVYVHDRTAAQTAATLGIPVGTVKSRLHYGLINLRGQAAELGLAA